MAALSNAAARLNFSLIHAMGAPPPIYEFMPPMPPMEFHQGWVEPQRLVHERLYSSSKDWFQSKNRFEVERGRGKHVKVETRTSEVNIVEVGSHDAP